MARRALNPFVPGRGALPPHLAGREAEKRTLRGILDYVEAGRGAPRDVVLSGPRGNGKTVLLRWFQAEVEKLGGGIEVLWRTPSDLPSVDGLATSLVPPGRFKSLLPDSLSLSIRVGRVGWELGDNPGTLAELLTLRCRQRPLVVLLDEAHTLGTDVGRALLNASQSVAALAPFLLVLAGTPGLAPQLNTMSATFWDRAEQVAIGLLDQTAAAEALTRPFEAEVPPVTLEAAALAWAIEASQCYPYFLQLVGGALWDVAAATGRGAIDGGVVAQAADVFDQRRATYYDHRYDELERADLLDVASAIARACRGRNQMTQAEVNDVIAAARPKSDAVGDGDEALRIRDQLAAVGYIWKAPGEGHVWRPGIPSLMAHIERSAASLDTPGRPRV